MKITCSAVIVAAAAQGRLVLAVGVVGNDHHASRPERRNGVTDGGLSLGERDPPRSSLQTGCVLRRRHAAPPVPDSARSPVSGLTGQLCSARQAEHLDPCARPAGIFVRGRYRRSTLKNLGRGASAHPMLLGLTGTPIPQ